MADFFVLHHIIGCKRFEWEEKKRVYTFKFGSIKSKRQSISRQTWFRLFWNIIEWFISYSKFQMVAVLILFVYWMGQEPLEIHTLSSSPHHSDGEEKDTHISSQQLFSWGINRARCAPRANTSYKTARVRDDSDQLKWRRRRASEWSNKQESVNIIFKCHTVQIECRSTTYSTDQSCTHFRHFP